MVFSNGFNDVSHGSFAYFRGVSFPESNVMITKNLKFMNPAIGEGQQYFQPDLTIVQVFGFHV